MYLTRFNLFGQKYSKNNIYIMTTLGGIGMVIWPMFVRWGFGEIDLLRCCCCDRASTESCFNQNIHNMLLWASKKYCCTYYIYKITPPINHMLHPLPGPHHLNSFVFRAGLEPGILAREAGALPRRLKSLASVARAPLWITTQKGIQVELGKVEGFWSALHCYNKH